MKSRNLNCIKNIAFIADDIKKTELIEWSYFNRRLLAEHNIIATGMAGNILEGTLNKVINKIPAAGFGGYQKLTALIEEGKVDALIVFSEDTGIHLLVNAKKSLLASAEENNIVVAVNRTTADFVLNSEFMHKTYLITAADSLQADEKKINNLEQNNPQELLAAAI